MSLEGMYQAERGMGPGERGVGATFGAKGMVITQSLKFLLDKGLISAA